MDRAPPGPIPISPVSAHRDSCHSLSVIPAARSSRGLGICLFVRKVGRAILSGGSDHFLEQVGLPANAARTSARIERLWPSSPRFSVHGNSARNLGEGVLETLGPMVAFALANPRVAPSLASMLLGQEQSGRGYEDTRNAIAVGHTGLLRLLIRRWRLGVLASPHGAATTLVVGRARERPFEPVWLPHQPGRRPLCLQRVDEQRSAVSHEVGQRGVWEIVSRPSWSRRCSGWTSVTEPPPPLAGHAAIS